MYVIQTRENRNKDKKKSEAENLCSAMIDARFKYKQNTISVLDRNTRVSMREELIAMSR